MALRAAEQGKCTYCHRAGHLWMLKVADFTVSGFITVKDLRGGIHLKVTAARRGGAEMEATKGD